MIFRLILTAFLFVFTPFWAENLPNLATKKTEKILVPKDVRCPICGMLVSKNPHWAAMIDDGEKQFYFDGVKDMMKYYFKNEQKFDKIFVSDYYRLYKINAKDAFFVIGSNIYGPMGDELIPFLKEQDALNFAHDHYGKKVLRFDEIELKMIERL